MTAEIKQINIFNTVFNFAEQYDPEIKNIKVYGILDQNGNCKEPYFRAGDVMKYFKKSHTYRHYKIFKQEKEIVKRKVKGINRKCNMFTKYGLIRCIALCGNVESKASVAFREFIYALFDAIDCGNVYIPSVIESYTNEMNSIDVQVELKSIDESEKNSVVYFIKNLTTNSIKIGYTGNIEHRLSCLQTGNDCELKVIKTIKGNLQTETQLHNKFAEYHIRGEWYKISEEQISDL
jgi:hypothetical protein